MTGRAAISLAAAFLTATIAAGDSPIAQPPCDRSPLVVRNTSVWMPTGVLRHRDVVVRDGRIAAIEPSASRPSADMRTIDGAGHTLLPGFVDLHLHFVIPGGLPANETPRTDVADISGRQLLRSGITSGRLHLATVDEASTLKRRSIDACQTLPRLQVGGPGLSGAAERDYGNFQGARSTDDAIAKIERFRGAGVDWVAIHDADRFAPGVLETIVRAARSANIRLMAAGNTPAEIAAALTMQPDTLDYFDRSPAPRYTDEILQAMRTQANLALVPTPGVPFRTTTYVKTPSLLENPASFDQFTDSDRAHVIATAKKDLAGQEAGRSERVMQSLPEKFQQLRRLGLTMAVGSDAGSTLHFPADAIWWDLEAWRSLGVPHREVLIAATEAGARVLRTADTGRIAPGSRADVILYKGDVESGPFDVSRVIAVVKDGVRHR